MIPTPSRVRLVERWLRAESISLRLFMSPHVPQRDDIVESFDELVRSNYKAFTIKSTDWKITADKNGLITVEAPGKTWTFGAGDPVVIYGSFLEGWTTGDLYWSEVFDEPCALSREGERLRVIARRTFAIDE